MKLSATSVAEGFLWSECVLLDGVVKAPLAEEESFLVTVLGVADSVTPGASATSTQFCCWV